MGPVGEVSDVARWINVVPIGILRDIPARTVERNGHRCAPPTDAAVGPRSVWECDCGLRWRITAPYWRPIGPLRDLQDGGDMVQTSLPLWVLALNEEHRPLDPGSAEEGP